MPAHIQSHHASHSPYKNKIVSAADAQKNWRPGGYQAFAVHPSGRWAVVAMPVVSRLAVVVGRRVVTVVGSGGVVVAVVVPLQVAFSHWWLSKFLYGPMEWLWRAITYWKLPRFKISKA